MSNPYTRAESIGRYDQDFGKIIKGSKITFGSMGRNQPIPNHLLSSEKNKNGEDRGIFFTGDSYKTLQLIKQLNLKIDEKTVVPPIEFLCVGYTDHDSDVIIEKIICPFLNPDVQKTHKSNRQLKESASKSHEAVINALNRYLAEETLNNGQGKGIVALLGTTKQPDDTLTSNCITLGEIADSLAPANTPIKSDKITSGVLAITPYLREYNSNSKAYADHLIEGSLECILTSYNIKNGIAVPCKVENVKRACNHTTPLLISASYQPFYLNYKNPENLI